MQRDVFSEDFMSAIATLAEDNVILVSVIAVTVLLVVPLMVGTGSLPAVPHALITSPSCPTILIYTLFTITLPSFQAKQAYR